MTQKPDRNKIKAILEAEAKKLRDDLNSVVDALNKLGSTVGPDDKKEREDRAEEYRALEFKGSMVKMQLTLYETVISHAEHCGYYMDLNDSGHDEIFKAMDSLRVQVAENIEKFTAQVNKRFDKVDIAIKPLIQAKQGFATLKVLTATIVGIVALGSTWLNWAKIFGDVPK